MPVKKRLDVVLVERGLAESRAQAQALVMAGLVAGYGKPGVQVDEEVELRVAASQRYVSRGGEKLANGLVAYYADRGMYFDADAFGRDMDLVFAIERGDAN